MINYADLAIIVILVLAFIWGLIRGFWRSFSKAVTLIGALALAFFLSSTLAPTIFNSNITEPINNVVSQFVVNNETAQGYIIGTGDTWGVFMKGASAPMTMEAALVAMYVPKFLHAPIVASLGNIAAQDLIAGVTVRSVVCSAYTHLLTVFLTGVIIFLASLIVLRIIAKLIYNALRYRHYLTGVDRFFGAIFRLVTGSLLILIIMHVISIFSGIEQLAPVIDIINEGKISSVVYDKGLEFINNLFYGDGMSKLADIFKDVILPAKEATEQAALAISQLI